MTERLGWVGEIAGAEAFLSANEGTIWISGDAPSGWRRSPSPAEACADFTFVSAGEDGLAALLGRGILNSAPAGSCVVLRAGAEGHEAMRAFARRLDDAGLDALDVAFLDGRTVFGGDRDTFNLVKPAVAACGQAFYCGPIGAATAARDAEQLLLGMPEVERIDALPTLVEKLERAGYFPQPIRNALKAGRLASSEFDAAIDALTRRP